MGLITLTEEQLRILQESGGQAGVVDAQGNAYTPIRLELTAEQIAEMKRRAASPGPWYTGAQVQARLKALEAEWERTGGFDEAYMRAFMQRLNEDDPGHYRPSGPTG